jgi:molecular chaperone GrpE
MSTASCSSGPGPISRITRSAPSATWPRSGATPRPLALELLPALDNLQRALDAASKQGDQGPLARGVAMVESQLMGVLGRFGIAPMIALNQPFDPNVHEAVSQVPRTDVPPGTIVEVLQPGYRLHERVLRPAKVAVATAPAPEA